MIDSANTFIYDVKKINGTRFLKGYFFGTRWNTFTKMHIQGAFGLWNTFFRGVRMSDGGHFDDLMLSATRSPAPLLTSPSSA